MSILLFMLLPFFDVLVYGVFIYYIARPVFLRIKGKIKSMDTAIFISLLLFVIPVIFLGLYALSVASLELNKLITNNELLSEGYVKMITDKLVEIPQSIDFSSITHIIPEHGGNMIGEITAYLLGILNIVVKLLLSLLLGAYLLKYASALRDFIEDNMLPGERGFTHELFNSVDSHLSGIFFGTVLTILATSLIGTLTFTLLNTIAPPDLTIPYPMLLGVLCGVATLIPAIGLKAVWIPLLLSLIIRAYLGGILFTEWWFLALFFVVVNIFVDFTPDLLLRPLLGGRGIHKGALMLAYIFGPAVFGFIGLFLGPIILVLSVNFLRLVLPRIREK